MPHSLEAWLASGGDARVAQDARGMNKYGCFAVPQPDILAYGSCTASTISQAGFAAAGQLYRRLETASHGEAACVAYARETARLREEFSALCGLDSLPGTDIIFGASGTDLHLFAAQLLYAPDAPLLVIMPEAVETGSGVPMALQSRHFSARTALGGAVTAGEAVAQGTRLEIAAVKSRLDNGGLRPASVIDAEAEALAERAVARGARVLLIITDLSKTGLIVPSAACAASLKRRFPEQVDILVDACQFRLGNAILRAYLERDFLLAMTGSKFITGPAFSAALLAPPAMARRLRRRTLPPALTLYSARADWPAAWEARAALPDTANYGLLLRWEAALAEWRAFHALDDAAIRGFLERFAESVQRRLAEDPVFEPLPTGEINRRPLIGGAAWDQLPTIFPFLMRHPPSGALLSKEAMAALYERLIAARCRLGQPAAACGALRLCLDMRLIVDALSPNGRGGDAVIADAMRVLDKAAMLA